MWILLRPSAFVLRRLLGLPSRLRVATLPLNVQGRLPIRPRRGSSSQASATTIRCQWHQRLHGKYPVPSHTPEPDRAMIISYPILTMPPAGNAMEESEDAWLARLLAQSDDPKGAYPARMVGTRTVGTAVCMSVPMRPRRFALSQMAPSWPTGWHPIPKIMKGSPMTPVSCCCAIRPKPAPPRQWCSIRCT
ncbi:protein of unknown function (plasmid) [Cupriavidus taiwanensis]|uniref:Uncharacterized protein n=1 Tax=Cupriavidus taiwanensis TaxID=164546 RepID=A0A375IP57_9BURK|nr:protein of unknown function [Cupriavidus taiwanensis]